MYVIFVSSQRTFPQDDLYFRLDENQEGKKQSTRLRKEQPKAQIQNGEHPSLQQYSIAGKNPGVTIGQNLNIRSIIKLRVLAFFNTV